MNRNQQFFGLFSAAWKTGCACAAAVWLAGTGPAFGQFYLEAGPWARGGMELKVDGGSAAADEGVQVADRDDADHAPVRADHRQVAEAALVHPVERVDRRLVRRDGLGIGGHHPRHRRRVRIEAARHHAHQQVALGEDPGNPAAFDDQQGTDLLFRHQAASGTDGHVLAAADQGPTGQQVADDTSWHCCLLCCG